MFRQADAKPEAGSLADCLVNGQDQSRFHRGLELLQGYHQSSFPLEDPANYSQHLDDLVEANPTDFFGIYTHEMLSTASELSVIVSSPEFSSVSNRVMETNVDEYIQRNVPILIDKIQDSIYLFDLDHVDFHPEPVNYQDVLNSVIHSFKNGKWGSSPLEIVYNSEEVNGHTDPMPLSTVLGRLLENAAKYGNPSPESPIELSYTRHPDGQVDIAVSDHGIGISAEDIARIGQPGFRTENAIASQAPGTGNGITRFREIAEKLGGHMDISSPGVNRGSTFTIHLPS